MSKLWNLLLNDGQRWSEYHEDVPMNQHDTLHQAELVTIFLGHCVFDAGILLCASKCPPHGQYQHKLDILMEFNIGINKIWKVQTNKMKIQVF